MGNDQLSQSPGTAEGSVQRSPNDARSPATIKAQLTLKRTRNKLRKSLTFIETRGDLDEKSFTIFDTLYKVLTNKFDAIIRWPGLVLVSVGLCLVAIQMLCVFGKTLKTWKRIPLRTFQQTRLWILRLFSACVALCIGVGIVRLHSLLKRFLEGNIIGCDDMNNTEWFSTSVHIAEIKEWYCDLDELGRQEIRKQVFDEMITFLQAPLSIMYYVCIAVMLAYGITTLVILDWGAFQGNWKNQGILITAMIGMTFLTATWFIAFRYWYNPLRGEFLITTLMKEFVICIILYIAIELSGIRDFNPIIPVQHTNSSSWSLDWFPWVVNPNANVFLGIFSVVFMQIIMLVIVCFVVYMLIVTFGSLFTERYEHLYDNSLLRGRSVWENTMCEAGVYILIATACSVGIALFRRYLFRVPLQKDPESVIPNVLINMMYCGIMYFVIRHLTKDRPTILSSESFPPILSAPLMTILLLLVLLL